VANGLLEVIVGAVIGLISTILGVWIQHQMSQRGERKRNRLDLVYGPLYGAVTEIRKRIPLRSDPSKLTVGFPMSATREFKIIEEVFTRWPHMIQNKKVMEGWLKVGIIISRSGELVQIQMNQDTDTWFKEIEKEYRRITEPQFSTNIEES